MKLDHLSETQIQQYVLNERNRDYQIADHMKVCENCRAAAAGYRLLFSEIKKTPNSAFEFNLSSLVLMQVSQRKQGFSRSDLLDYSIVLLGILTLIIPGFLFREALHTIIPPLLSSFLYLSTTITISITLFYILGIYKEHRRKMESLNI